jgi:hypothetical protein
LGSTAARVAVGEASQLVAERIAQLADLHRQGEIVDVVFVEAREHGLAGCAQQDETADPLGVTIVDDTGRVPRGPPVKRRRPLGSTLGGHEPNPLIAENENHGRGGLSWLSLTVRRL